MSEQENDALDEELADASSGGSTKAVIVAVLLAVLVSNGVTVGIYYMLVKPAMASAESAGASEETESPAEGDSETPGPLVDVEPLVVNLNEPGEPRYLRLTIKLEVADEEAVTEVENRSVRLRDAYISHLSSYSSQELRTFEDKKRLRAKLLELAREAVSERAIVQVYFADFMMQ